MGDPKQGIARLLRGVASCTEQGVALDKPYYLALLAEACAAGGDIPAAMAAVEEALELIAPLRSFFYAAELYRIRAGLGAAGDADAARDDLRNAVTLARAQAARSIELRAACDWAQLSRQHGWDREAFDVLASVTASFAEGHDTADLKAAARLLTSRPTARRASRS